MEDRAKIFQPRVVHVPLLTQSELGLDADACSESSTMGLSISTLFSSLSSLVRWSKDQDVRILMLGLDSAGKVRVGQVFTISFEV